jgi:hypothetical protein
MGFRQLNLYKDSRHICEPIAGLLMLPPEFTKRFSVEFFDLDDKDGLGPFKAALVETDSGRRFGLVHYILHPEPKGIAVWTDERSADFGADLRDFMQTFGFTRADFFGVYGEEKAN